MRRLGILAAALSLAGCAVGPDYVRPAARPVQTGAFGDPAAIAAVAVTPVAPADPRWWRLFDDPVLDRLVADALAYNTSVREASANLRQARAALSEARGGRLPTTDVSGTYSRTRIGGAAAGLQGGGLTGGTGTGGTGGGTGVGGGTGTGGVGGIPIANAPDFFEFNFYRVGFDASYELDLFGRVSRTIEEARGSAEAAAADLDAARIAVAAEVARTYALACANAAQADVAAETAELQGRTLDLTRRLLAGGRGTQREVDQATVLAESARANVPRFEAERRAALYGLAQLTGRPPAEVDGAAAQCRLIPAVKVSIPVGDGAGLLARRPDVRAAERRLASASARIGVETAALYPSISLMGSANLSSTRASDLGKSRSFGFSLGPLISWSFPNISVARARIRQAEAGNEVALARFDGTVLTALSETESALARYAAALDRRASLETAAAAADNAARISRIRFDAGRDNFLQLLDSERDRASARTANADAQSAVAEAQVALFQALGGGWEGAGELVTRSSPAGAK